MDDRSSAKEQEATEKYDNLWDKVRNLDDSSFRTLLCFLMGFCKHNDQFLRGVEWGLATYNFKELEEVRQTAGSKEVR